MFVCALEKWGYCEQAGAALNKLAYVQTQCQCVLCARVRTTLLFADVEIGDCLVSVL